MISRRQEAGGRRQKVKSSTVKGFAALDSTFNYVRLLKNFIKFRVFTERKKPQKSIALDGDRHPTHFVLLRYQKDMQKTCIIPDKTDTITRHLADI